MDTTHNWRSEIFKESLFFVNLKSPKEHRLQLLQLLLAINVRTFTLLLFSLFLSSQGNNLNPKGISETIFVYRNSLFFFNIIYITITTVSAFSISFISRSPRTHVSRTRFPYAFFSFTTMWYLLWYLFLTTYYTKIILIPDI